MKIAVEISLYPLDREFIPPIQDFIDRLNRHPGLAVVTNAMSTQVSGEHDVVFDALRTETAVTFAARHRAVFVMKVLGGSD
ncbi:MAG: YkoF family thiamine/hydroxymethylpyrimidine-binding protein [Steroidobacteraceae bacterium]